MRLNLETLDARFERGLRIVKVEFERLAQVGERFVGGLALAGYIDLKALSDIPRVLVSDGGGEGPLIASVPFKRTTVSQQSYEVDVWRSIRRF